MRVFWVMIPCHDPTLYMKTGLDRTTGPRNPTTISFRPFDELLPRSYIATFSWRGLCRHRKVTAPPTVVRFGRRYSKPDSLKPFRVVCCSHQKSILPPTPMWSSQSNLIRASRPTRRARQPGDPNVPGRPPRGRLHRDRPVTW